MQCDVKKFEPGYWRLLVPTYVLCTGYVPYDKKTAGYQKIRGKRRHTTHDHHEKNMKKAQQATATLDFVLLLLFDTLKVPVLLRGFSAGVLTLLHH